MPISYRLARPTDIPALATLFESYMEETYEWPWRGTTERLSQDLGSPVHIALAVLAEHLVGFVAWTPTYDLHHCYQGVEIVDMFVVPAHRGQATAVGLLATAAAHAANAGAKFLKGGAVPRGSGMRLYERAAIRHGDTFHLSGRAFRALAEADTTTPRSLAKAVLLRGWNFEA